ncbi:SEC-C domain-containing protein [Ectothiorhodospiraceae bacterium 2226]|nr:SEC-C domain-containing protein [Ectothiorhodospiraceae bacterium 2226]
MKPRTHPSDAPCPCGSGAPYGACCEPLLSEREAAPTAERLMRSRYTAFVLHDAHYLLRSWHSRTRPPNLNVPSDGEWLGLKVLETEAGGPHDQQGTVEFVARYKYRGTAERLHERSRFEREEGAWRYVDAVDFPEPATRGAARRSKSGGRPA